MACLFFGWQLMPKAHDPFHCTAAAAAIPSCILSLTSKRAEHIISQLRLKLCLEEKKVSPDTVYI
jgi:hypothetical protein